MLFRACKIYVFICVYVGVGVYTCACDIIHTWLNSIICIYVYSVHELKICVCACTYVYVCIHVYVYTMCVCGYICMNTC